MDILSIIESNRKIQKEANIFNIQAGEEVFHIMTNSEWKSHLKNILNGARNVSEIKDLNILKIPQLDSEMIKIISEYNPNTITIDDQVLNIEYSKTCDRFYVLTNVDEEFARKTSLENIKLPGGRIVEICCNGLSSNNFIDLVKKLEDERIQRRWSQVSSMHEKWTSNLSTVLEWIPKVSTKVEITRDENGESIVGFLSLKHEHNGWTLFITNNEQKLTEEIQEVIEQILYKYIEKSFMIPKEEPWYKDNGGVFFTNWVLTELGEQLQDKYNTIICTNDYNKNLSINNVIYKINEIKQISISIKNEIEFGVNGNKIEDLKSSVELLRDSFNANKCYKK